MNKSASHFVYASDAGRFFGKGSRSNSMCKDACAVRYRRIVLSVFDCTRKLPAEGFDREWPDVIEMSPDVKARVDALWSDLGI